MIFKLFADFCKVDFKIFNQKLKETHNSKDCVDCVYFLLGHSKQIRCEHVGQHINRVS